MLCNFFHSHTFQFFLCVIIFFFVFWVFSAMPCSMQDPRSPAKDWTHAPAVETQSPDHWSAREVSLCPHWKELLIQVRVDPTTSSYSTCVVSRFTPGLLHQKSIPGSGVKSGSLLGEGVSAAKEELWEKPLYHFNYRLLNPYYFSSVSSKVWDGICMSGMGTCTVSPVCRGPSALLSMCWRFLLSPGHPSFLTLSSLPPPTPVLPQSCLNQW